MKKQYKILHIPTGNYIWAAGTVLATKSFDKMLHTWYNNIIRLNNETDITDAGSVCGFFLATEYMYKNDYSYSPNEIQIACSGNKRILKTLIKDASFRMNIGMDVLNNEDNNIPLPIIEFKVVE